MALEILDFVAIFSFFLFIIVTLKIVRNLKKTPSIPNIPPGPWKLPIIGNIPNLLTATPHRKLRDLAKIYGPLMHLQLGEIFTVVVSSPEYAKEVMKIHDLNFASRPHLVAMDMLSYDYTDIAFTPYGDYWRQVRKICNIELFSAKRVQYLWPIRYQENTNLIKSIASQEGSVVNLTEAVVSLFYSTTSRTAFGKKYKEQEEFISAVQQVIKLAGGFQIGDLFPSAKWLRNLSGMRTEIEKLHKQFDQILDNIFNDHREARSRTKEGPVLEADKDLIDVLLAFEDGSSDVDFRLTNKNVKAIIFDIFTAGSETSATTVDWAMAEMVKNPRVLNKAQAEVREVFDKRGKVDETGLDELKYLKSVIKETLRFHPALPLLLPRECAQACEINGYHIPVKSRGMVNVWAIGRDPKYWDEPESFYPERFEGCPLEYRGTNFEYTPFGAGRRICPGMNNGLANVELALALLLYHFDWRLPSGKKIEDLDMTEEFGVTVSRKDHLHVIPIVSRPLLVT